MSAASGEMLETAARIGARLCRDAVWDGRRCNWLGSSMEVVGGAWVVAHKSFGPDLYAGTSGIAWFLAHLWRATGEPIFRHVAEGALAQARSRRDQIPGATRHGLYSGLLGVAWAELGVGEIFGREDLVEDARQVVHGLGGEDPPAEGIDVIMGSGGAIAALIDVHHRLQGDSDGVLGLARRHGELLLETADRGDDGWSWDTLSGGSQRNLTGFAHGAAGIAWALLELFGETGDARYRTAAEEGFRYERRWYDAEQENWPDFRDHESLGTASGDGPIYAVAWCHGAPGIGLSRLRAVEILGDEIYRGEAEAAVRTTTRALGQPVGDFSLCHGAAGNAELLLYAGQVLDPDHRAAAEAVGRFGVQQYEREGLAWPCGVPGGGEAPNLMLGLAGIGYFYLRLHDPEAHPSMLLLRPTPAAR